MTNPNPETRRVGHDYPLRDAFKQALISQKGYSEVVAYSMSTCIVNSKAVKHKQARTLWVEVMNGASFPPLLGEAPIQQVPLPTVQAEPPAPIPPVTYEDNPHNILSFVIDVLALRDDPPNPVKDSLILDLITKRIGMKKSE